MFIQIFKRKLNYLQIGTGFRWILSWWTTPKYKMGRKKKDKVEEKEVITTRTPRKWNPGLSILLLLFYYLRVSSEKDSPTKSQTTQGQTFDPMSFDPVSFDPGSFDPLSVNPPYVYML